MNYESFFRRGKELLISPLAYQTKQERVSGKTEIDKSPAFAIRERFNQAQTKLKGHWYSGAISKINKFEEIKDVDFGFAKDFLRWSIWRNETGHARPVFFFEHKEYNRYNNYEVPKRFLLPLTLETSRVFFCFLGRVRNPINDKIKIHKQSPTKQDILDYISIANLWPFDDYLFGLDTFFLLLQTMRKYYSQTFNVETFIFSSFEYKGHHGDSSFVTLDTKTFDRMINEYWKKDFEKFLKPRLNQHLDQFLDFRSQTTLDKILVKENE